MPTRPRNRTTTEVVSNAITVLTDDTVRSPYTPDAVERAAPQGNTNIVLGPNDERQPNNNTISLYTSMYKQHPIVRAAVDKLAKTSVTTGYLFQARDPEIEASSDKEDSRITTLRDTFARSRAQALLKQTYQDLLIYGDAFWLIGGSDQGVPFSFKRVFPSSIAKVIDKTTREITSWIIRDSTGTETQYEPLEILHFRIYDPANEHYGLSPLESLKSTVTQDLFAQQYNEAFFGNSAQTGIVFNMRNASKAEVDRNREFLKKEYTSVQNAHKPLLLEGDVDVKKSVASPAEMQFIDGRRELKAEILAVLDVPHTKIGGSYESANRSQSAENDKSFRAEAIQPLQAIVEEEITEFLIVQVFGFDDIVFKHKDVDSRDEQAQMKVFLDGLTHGIYTLNSIKKKLGEPSVEGGDVPFILTPTGLIPVNMIEDQAKAMIEGRTNPVLAPTEPRNEKTPNE